MQNDKSPTSLEGRMNAREALKAALLLKDVKEFDAVQGSMQNTQYESNLNPDMIFLSGKRKFYFRDFLSLSNEHFLDGVYIAFMRRPPDASARAIFNFSDYPRSARLGIVLQVYNSEERKRRGTHLYHAWFWYLINKSMGVIYPIYRGLRKIIK